MPTKNQEASGSVRHWRVAPSLTTPTRTRPFLRVSCATEVIHFFHLSDFHLINVLMKGAPAVDPTSIQQPAPIIFNEGNLVVCNYLIYSHVYVEVKPIP